jgi:hypothetical protein
MIDLIITLVMVLAIAGGTAVLIAIAINTYN